MDNPLKQLLPVEERSDGVYLKVVREQKEKIPIQSMIKALQDGLVVNFDVARIIDVWTRARGVFERIGPIFDYYDVALDRYVDVAVEPLKAYAMVNSTYVAENHQITEQRLAFCLARKGVRFGLRSDAIRQLVKTVAYDYRILVAEGKAPVDGQTGGIHFEVSVTPEKTPKILPDGSVDFRDIRSFVQVAKGQVIANRTPPTPGTPGKAVSGEEIPAKPGKDYALVPTGNVLVSPDGNSLVAKVSGLIFIEKGLLNISEKLNIPGDVDFEVGNIKFSGNVMIGGNVKSGFTVESEGSIEIKGDVESATIRSRNGSVTIHRAVIGNTVIYAKTGVRLSFAQNATIMTEGRLVIDHYCLHCTCTCDHFESRDGAGGIIGGIMQAYSSVKAVNIGNEKEVVTRVEIVDREKVGLEAKLVELGNLRQKLDDQLAPVKRQLSTKAAIFKKAGETVTDRYLEEIKKWVDLYNAVTMKLEYVTRSIAQINGKLSKPGATDSIIEVTGDVFPGTQIGFYGIMKFIRAKMTRTQFVAKSDEIEG